MHITPDTFRFTVILGILAALPALSIDISQPTTLAVQAELHAPAHIVGMTITFFMLGFALGQFGAGPLSDRHGRRPILILSLVGYIVAAIGCALAGSANALLGWRFVQGIGAGACAVLAFTMIRDLFEGEAARVKRSYVIVVLGLAPILAPTFGAWLLTFAGWRSIYVLLAGAGTLLLAAITISLGESRTVDGTGPPPLGVGAAYRSVLSDRRFVLMAVLNALSYGTIFAYIAGAPMLLMGDLALSPTGFGAFFACTAGALTLGAYVSGRCAKQGVGARPLLWLSLVLAAVAAVALAALLAMDLFAVGPLLVLLLVSLFSRGIIAPNAQHLALEPIKEQAGTAAATVGVMQILTGALASAVVALLMPIVGPSGMSLVMAVLALASIGLWMAVSRSNPRSPAP